MLRIAFFVSMASVLGLGRDCGGDDADTPATPPATAAPVGNTPPPTTAKKAGKLTGSIADARGNVIAIPGTTFAVFARGTSLVGENQTVPVPVAANGTFEVDLAAGNYHANAEIEVPFNGATYTLPLAPINRPSSEGIVQDFV